jgi:hypothetical protein
MAFTPRIWRFPGFRKTFRFRRARCAKLRTRVGASATAPQRTNQNPKLVPALIPFVGLPYRGLPREQRSEVTPQS